MAGFRYQLKITELPTELKKPMGEQKIQRCLLKLNEHRVLYMPSLSVYKHQYSVKKINYRVTHKGCNFSDDLKLLKSSKFIGVMVFTFCLTLVDIYQKYWEQKYSCSDLLQSTEFVKTRQDKLSKVVVEVASFLSNPVCSNKDTFV